jgi:hypothetical protein
MILIEDARILEGHGPAGEIHESGLPGHVGLMQGGLFHVQEKPEVGPTNPSTSPNPSRSFGYAQDKQRRGREERELSANE